MVLDNNSFRSNNNNSRLSIPDDAYPLIYVRSALGIIFVLFMPGYVLIKTIYPKQNQIKSESTKGILSKNISANMYVAERILLSLGISIALIPIVGLILNCTPWGIRLAPAIFIIVAFTLVFATVSRYP